MRHPEILTANVPNGRECWLKVLQFFNSNTWPITLAQYEDYGVDDAVRILKPVSLFGKYRGDNTVGESSYFRNMISSSSVTASLKDMAKYIT